MASAIFRTGGKQYRVAEGARLRIESIPGAAGEKVVFNEVLAIDGDQPKFGKPLLAGATIEAEILGQRLAEKIIVFKFRRRKRFRRKAGHRQRLTEVRITRISA
jgi:large subunit ribosomal protein L21